MNISISNEYELVINLPMLSTGKHSSNTIIQCILNDSKTMSCSNYSIKVNNDHWTLSEYVMIKDEIIDFIKFYKVFDVNTKINWTVNSVDGEIKTEILLNVSL